MLLEEYGIRYILMSSVRIDKINFASIFGAFLNYATTISTIVVAATPLASGASRTISVTIPYSRGGTVADIYAKRSTIKTLITNGGRAAATAIYNRVSTELSTFNVSYSASNITVSLVITNNTIFSITPNAQNIDISVVQYDAPITSI